MAVIRLAAMGVAALALAGGGFWLGRTSAPPTPVPEGYINVSVLPPEARKMVSDPKFVGFLAKVIHIENGEMKLYDPTQDSHVKAMPAGYPAWPGSKPLLKPKANMAWPDVALTGGAGPQAAKDKWAFVDLWAFWCTACLVEMPQLDSLAGEISRDKAIAARAGLFVVNADPNHKDTAAQVKTLFAAKGYSHLAPLTTEAGVTDEVLKIGDMSSNVVSYPITLIYAPGGQPFAYVIGAPGWGKPEMLDFVRKLSALPAPPA